MELEVSQKIQCVKDLEKRYRAGQKKEVEAMAKVLVATEPNEAVWHFWLGLAREQQGELVTSAQAYAEAARLEPMQKGYFADLTRVQTRLARRLKRHQVKMAEESLLYLPRYLESDGHPVLVLQPHDDKPDVFWADNSVVRSDTAGLGFRKSMDRTDLATRNEVPMFLEWGHSIKGMVCGEWLKVEKRPCGFMQSDATPSSQAAPASPCSPSEKWHLKSPGEAVLSPPLSSQTLRSARTETSHSTGTWGSPPASGENLSTWLHSKRGQLASLRWSGAEALSSNQSFTSSTCTGDSAPANDCVVCMDAPVSHVVVPCGHMCLCGRCSAAVDQCPVCRATVQSMMRVYHTDAG